MSYETIAKVMAVIEYVSQGRTVSDACDFANVGYTTFRNYIRDNAELNDLFVEAEQRGQDIMADALLNIDTHELYGSTDPKMAAVKSKNIQWFLARKRPKDYGDRMIVENHITADKAILDALQHARDRVSQTIIDGTATHVMKDVTPPIALPAVVDDEEELLKQFF